MGGPPNPPEIQESLSVSCLFRLYPVKQHPPGPHPLPSVVVVITYNGMGDVVVDGYSCA